MIEFFKKIMAFELNWENVMYIFRICITHAEYAMIMHIVS